MVVQSPARAPSRPAATRRSAVCSRGLEIPVGGSRLAAGFLTTALAFGAMYPAGASAHDPSIEITAWHYASAAIMVPGIPAQEIAAAARLDVAVEHTDARSASLMFARWLVERMENPDIGLDAPRGVRIFRSFVYQGPRRDSSFWSEFSLACVQRMAGEDLAVADTLERALVRAKGEDLPPDLIARTKGIMGHARQTGGDMESARRTFEELERIPAERAHAVAHLGQIALSTRGVEAGLETWLRDPGVAVAGITAIVEEADALWLRDPDLSYDLVAKALDRVPRLSAHGNEAELTAAVGRLRARARANVASIARYR